MKKYNKKLDVFRNFMIKGAEFDGYWEMPIIPISVKSFPESLKEVDDYSDDFKGSFIHFYLEDYRFDGPLGIWNKSIKNINAVKGFRIDRYLHCEGFISPDYSICLGEPLCQQIDQIRRSRYIGYWLYSIGFKVIPNVRWGDERTYDFAFLGVPKGSIISIGLYGTQKENILKKIFVDGLNCCIKTIKPAGIIFYGKYNKDIENICKYYQVSYKFFIPKSVEKWNKINGIEER